MFTERPRLSYVDSLRFVAACMVLMLHLFEHRPGIIHRFYVPLGGGVAGVAIFFFISGYVIPIAVRRGLDFRAFMIRRVFRIYPLFLAALALVLVGGATGRLPAWSYLQGAPASVWIANLLLVPEFLGVTPVLGVSWTLIVEIVWYAAFAASLVIFGKRAADRLDIIVPVVIVAAALASLIAGVRLPLGRPLMIYAAVIGFQCFRFHASEIARAHLVRSIATFVGVATFVNWVGFGVFVHERLSLAQAVWPWLFGTAVFCLWVLWKPLREARVLNRGVIPALGAMSYSTYLLHPVAIGFANANVIGAAQVPVALALTLTLSWLGYHLVERPGMRLGTAVAGLLRSPSSAKRFA